MLQDSLTVFEVCETLLTVMARVRQFTVVLLQLLGTATLSMFSLLSPC